MRGGFIRALAFAGALRAVAAPSASTVAVLVILVSGMQPIPGVVAQSVSVRDSVGVRIVESPAKSSVPVRYTLSTTGVVRLGGRANRSSREFNHNSGYLGGIHLSDGRIVVSDRDRLHWFDARGLFLRSMGRSGDGPGEFRYITSICRSRADTLVVWDDGNRRIGIVSPEGGFIRHLVATGSSPSVQACLDSGQVLLVGPDIGAKQVLAGRLIDLSGNVVSRGFQFPSGSYDAVPRVTSQVASGTRLIVGDGRNNEYRTFSADGRLIQVVRTRDRVRRISDPEYERLLDFLVPSQPKKKEITARLRAQRSSTEWPSYGRILADSHGCVWLQDYHIPDRAPAAESWVGFSQDGRMMGRLLLPLAEGVAQRQLVAVRQNIAQVRERDSEGFLTLVFARIEPSRPDFACHP